MRVTVEQKPLQKAYPYLGIHRADTNRPDPVVVLWAQPNVGVVLSTNRDADRDDDNRYPIGTLLNQDFFDEHPSLMLRDEHFIAHTSTITLSN